MRTCKLVVAVLVAGAFLVPGAIVFAQEIEPAAVGCLVRAPHPQLSVQIQPTPTFGKLFFKQTGTSDYYYVELTCTPAGACTGVLPTPMPDTTSIDLYFESGDARSATITVPVVDDKTECENPAPLSATGPAAVFSAAGAPVGLAAPFGVAAGAGAAAGGIGATTLIVGGAVAAGIVTVVAATGGDEQPPPPASPSQ